LRIVVAVRAVGEIEYPAADAVSFGGFAVALKLARRRIQSWRIVMRNKATTQKARRRRKKVVVGGSAAE
jgi:hypothetical protein